MSLLYFVIVLNISVSVAINGGVYILIFVTRDWHF